MSAPNFSRRTLILKERLFNLLEKIKVFSDSHYSMCCHKKFLPKLYFYVCRLNGSLPILRRKKNLGAFPLLENDNFFQQVWNHFADIRAMSTDEPETQSKTVEVSNCTC